MSSSIVVGWDGSAESVAALDWALAAGESDGSPVRIVSVVEPAAVEPRPRAEHSHETLRAMVGQELAAVREVQARAHPALSVTTLVVESSAVEALVGQSRGAALLVLGSRGAGGVLSLIVGSTTLAVAARTECPLVAVPGPDEEAGVGDGVVVGTDGSLVSEGAVAFAFEQARRLGTGLTVVHAWQETAIASVFDDGSAEGDESESRTSRLLAGLNQWLAPWSRTMPAVQVDARVVRGNPALILIDLSRDSRLLVVGSRGRAAVPRGWLGSVSQGVLHLAATPLAVVPGKR
jgi:nucleotide-binding universal stress UspA family protein